jgi:DNA invertase Pin-like site-specific DNA recombinase
MGDAGTAFSAATGANILKYGYARVSTDDQNTALQLAALKKAGCKQVFQDEGLSGATTKRPALIRCLKALRPGDTLIVWKLDRLGRSLRDLITMLDELRTQGVKFRSLTEHIDTETAAGRAMWQMIGVMAEMERSLIAERTRAGVKAAKSRGVKFGRKPKLTPLQITHARQQIDQGRTVKEVAALLERAPHDDLPRPCSAVVRGLTV